MREIVSLSNSYNQRFDLWRLINQWSFEEVLGGSPPIVEEALPEHLAVHFFIVFILSKCCVLTEGFSSRHSEGLIVVLDISFNTRLHGYIAIGEKKNVGGGYVKLGSKMSELDFGNELRSSGIDQQSGGNGQSVGKNVQNMLHRAGIKSVDVDEKASEIAACEKDDITGCLKLSRPCRGKELLLPFLHPA